MEPVAIVGDVHGNAPALDQAVAWLDKHWDADVVFVGDYVNRGSDPAAVLELLASARSDWGERLVLLRGNHDAALLEFLTTGQRDSFIRHGGLSTMRSYLGRSPSEDPFQAILDCFPEHHLRLLERLETCYQTSDLLVSHAGFNPDAPWSRSERDLVHGRHAKLFRPPLQLPTTSVVCGHYVQRTGVYRDDGFYCIDTGCGSVEGGLLSMLVLPDESVRTFGAL